MKSTNKFIAFPVLIIAMLLQIAVHKPTIAKAATISRVPFSSCDFASQDDQVIVRDYADFILSAMDSNGVNENENELAIARYPDGSYASRNISPYEGNYAAIGLLNAFEMTGDAQYKEAAWKWLRWYANAANLTTGYVTDYSNGGGDGIWNTTNDMDSTDSYAGTWLLAFYNAYRIDPLSEHIAALIPKVQLIHSAMMSTLDETDGLTEVKPAYPAKALADSAEVGMGLKATEILASLPGSEDASLKSLAETQKTNLYNGIENEFWNNPTGFYGWAKNASNTDQSSFDYFYADTFAQFTAVGYGVTSGTRAQSLMSGVVFNYPTWTDPTTLIQINGSGGSSPIGYWPIIGIARELTGADTSADFNALHTAIQNSNKPWPFNTHRAGDMITWIGLRNGCQSAQSLRGDYSLALSKVTNLNPQLEVKIPALQTYSSSTGVMPQSSSSHYLAELRKTVGTSKLPVAEFNITASDNYEWSGVTADLDQTNFKSVVHNLIETGAISGGSYSLLVPYRDGDMSVWICPNVVTLDGVNQQCSGGYALSETDSRTEIVTIDNIKYWKVSGITGTGGVSLADSTTITFSPENNEASLASTGNSVIHAVTAGSLIIIFTFITRKTAFYRLKR